MTFSIFNVAALLAALAALAVLVRFGYWLNEGRKLQTSGYMPPPSSRFARGFYKGACKLLSWLYVGPIKVIGEENQEFVGRGIILPNHHIWPDFAVVGKSIKFSFRQIAKAGEIKNPIVGALSAWIGTVGVQVEGGKSQDGAANAVVDAGAKVLAASYGSRMLLFPQGLLVPDNVLRPKQFRTGAMRIVRKAEAAIGSDPIYVLPVAVHYIRDPKRATGMHRFLHAIGLKFFRRVTLNASVEAPGGGRMNEFHVFYNYGAVVAIGKPIAVKDLPADAREATELVRQKIDELLTLAKNN